MKKGHYCVICGRYRPNEKFSGKGHAAHICKSCAKLPVEKRNELRILNRIEALPFYLSRDQRSWLEKMRKDRRENIKVAAEQAYELRFSSSTQPVTDSEDPIDGINVDTVIMDVALEHDIPVSSVRAAMQSAIHEGFMNPNGHIKEVFGNREPTVEEMIAYLAAKLEEVEFEE